jgi:hypothetical protein
MTIKFLKKGYFFASFTKKGDNKEVISFNKNDILINVDKNYRSIIDLNDHIVILEK